MSYHIVHIPLEVSPIGTGFDRYAKDHGDIFTRVGDNWRVRAGLLNAELVPFIQAFAQVYPALVGEMMEPDEKEFAEERAEDLKAGAMMLDRETFDFTDWDGALAKWEGVFPEDVFPMYGVDDEEFYHPTGADGTRFPYYSTVYVALHMPYYKHIEMDLFRHLCLYRFVQSATGQLAPRFALARFIGA